MKKPIIILLLSLAVYFTFADEEIKELPGGLILSFKSEFMNEYKQFFNQQFLEKFQQLNFPAVENTQQISIFNIYYQISNIKIHETKYNPNQTEISLHKDSPNFYVHMKDCVFVVSFDYHIKTQPELLEDIGVGKAWLNDLNITIKANPQVYDRFFQFEFQEISIDVEDFGLDMIGGDLSVVIDFLQNEFKAFIRQYLLGQMNDQTKEAFEGVVNDLLLTVPRDVTVEDGKLDIDYGLTSEGIVVTDDYFSIIMDGTFHLSEDPEPEVKNFTTMPIHVPEAEEVQIMISEYSINELLRCAVALDLIKYENYDQTSDNIDAIISEFEEALGEHPNVTMIVEAAEDLSKYNPNIKISQSGSLIEFYFEIRIMNPYDTTMDAAVIIAKSVSNITFTVNDDFELFGAVNDLKMSIEEFYPYFQTKTTKDNINSRLSILVTLMESYANSVLDDGYAIPISKNLTKYILKEKISELDGFLLIDGDADFSQNFSDFFFNLNLMQQQKPIQVSQQPLLKRKMRRNLQGQTPNERPLNLTQEQIETLEKEESRERFYSLVKQVYVHKLQFGDYDKDDYRDVYQAVDDIMAEYNNNDTSVQANWTDDMKEQQKLVTQDLQSGKLTWGDIQINMVRKIGKDVLGEIEQGADETYKVIKSMYMEMEDELQIVEKEVKQAAQTIDRIFRSFGGGRL